MPYRYHQDNQSLTGKRGNIMCNVCMPISDEAKATDEFADRLLDMLNQGALSLMVSIGHRTGLFDSLAELDSPGCEQLAAHAGLDPRYVREWLGAMVTGGIVKYLPDTDEYALPGSHAALLTRSAGCHRLRHYVQ